MSEEHPKTITVLGIEFTLEAATARPDWVVYRHEHWLSLYYTSGHAHPYWMAGLHDTDPPEDGDERLVVGLHNLSSDDAEEALLALGEVARSARTSSDRLLALMARAAEAKNSSKPDVTVAHRGREYVFAHVVGRYNKNDDSWDNEDLRVMLACEDGRWDAVLMDGPLASAASEGVVAVLNDYTTAQEAFDALIARSRRLYAHTHQLCVRLPDVEDRK